MCPQAVLWSACGGTDSISACNESDSSVCCPTGSSCRFYTSCFWRCEADWYTHPIDAPRDVCNASPPPPPPVVQSPVNVIQITATYSYTGLKCSNVDITVYAASLKQQAEAVVDASGGNLQHVVARCTVVLPVGRKRRHLLEEVDAVVIETLYVIIPKVGTGFAPDKALVLATAVDNGVIKNQEVAITALDEASSLVRVDIITVGCWHACVSDSKKLAQRHDEEPRADSRLCEPSCCLLCMAAMANQPGRTG